MVNSESLDRRIFNCSKCEEALKYRAYPMPGYYGSECYQKVAVVAQNPGLPNEVQRNKKFEFDETPEDYFTGLRKAKLGIFTEILSPVDWDKVFYSNIVKCAFPAGYSLKSEIEKCSNYLDEQLLLIDPKLIIAVGARAFHHFVPSQSILKNSLKKFSDTYGRVIVPVLHLSYLTRLPEIDQENYFRKAQKVLSSLAEELRL